MIKKEPRQKPVACRFWGRGEMDENPEPKFSLGGFHLPPPPFFQMNSPIIRGGGQRGALRTIIFFFHDAQGGRDREARSFDFVFFKKTAKTHFIFIFFWKNPEKSKILKKKKLGRGECR